MLPPHAYDELLLNSPSSQPTPAAAGSWGPFSGAGDFGTTMAIILAALFSTVLLAFSLTAAVRLLLARCHPSAERVDPEKSSSSAAAQVPTTLFSAAGTRLSGAVAECAICLTEFTEGDAVQVLPACNHGFHRRCVEQWLATRGSCPTCRAARSCDKSCRYGIVAANCQKAPPPIQEPRSSGRCHLGRAESLSMKSYCLSVFMFFMRTTVPYHHRAVADAEMPMKDFTGVKTRSNHGESSAL